MVPLWVTFVIHRRLVVLQSLWIWPSLIRHLRGP